MKILLTGATGYIGRRLMPTLLEQGHTVVCLVRDSGKIDLKKYNPDQVTLVEADLLDLQTLEKLPRAIDVAYYLVHSMSNTSGDFSEEEMCSATNFVRYLNETSAKQLIYLGGIINQQSLSKHLQSRKKVEEILQKGKVSLTALRAGIIVGSGSASFEIIRDLVEKLPIMIAPKWLHTKCQPISIRNVIQFLSGVVGKPFTYGCHFDLYGPNTLTYKQMLMQLAEVREVKRSIFIVPIFSPSLSSYWLYFITSTSYSLARNLVASMKVDVVGEPNDLSERLGIKLLSYRASIRLAFDKIEQNLVLSSWHDAGTKNFLRKGLQHYIQVPTFGVFTDKRKMHASKPDKALSRILAIGGKNGWYYGNWLWNLRGFIDRLFGGVGKRRGRKNAADINPGDALDFWRVILNSKEEKRLLLYAEMKIPGEAWLEFRLDDKNNIHQTATFRPLGIAGRLYWYTMLPFHYFIFRGMLNKITEA